MANMTNADTGGYKTQPTQGFYDYWIIKFCDTTQTTAINSPAYFREGLGVVTSPNPNNGSFTITIPSALSKDFSLRITDVLGQVVSPQSVGSDSNRGSFDVQLGNVAKGIYAVEVFNGSKIYRGRFVIR